MHFFSVDAVIITNWHINMLFSWVWVCLRGRIEIKKFSWTTFIDFFISPFANGPLWKGLCPVKIFTGHDKIWTHVQDSTCPIKTFTGHNPDLFENWFHCQFTGKETISFSNNGCQLPTYWKRNSNESNVNLYCHMANNNCTCHKYLTHHNKRSKILVN